MSVTFVWVQTHKPKDLWDFLGDPTQQVTVLLPPDSSIQHMNEAHERGTLTDQNVSDILQAHIITNFSLSFDSIRHRLGENFTTFGGTTIVFETLAFKDGAMVYAEGAPIGAKLGPHIAGGCAYLQGPRHDQSMACNSTSGSNSIHRVNMLLAPFDLSEFHPFFASASTHVILPPPGLPPGGDSHSEGDSEGGPEGGPEGGFGGDSNCEFEGSSNSHSNSNEDPANEDPANDVMRNTQGSPNPIKKGENLNGAEITWIVWGCVGVLLAVSGVCLRQLLRREHDIQVRVENLEQGVARNDATPAVLTRAHVVNMELAFMTVPEVRSAVVKM